METRVGNVNARCFVMFLGFAATEMRPIGPTTQTSSTVIGWATAAIECNRSRDPEVDGEIFARAGCVSCAQPSKAILSNLKNDCRTCP